MTVQPQPKLSIEERKYKILDILEKQRRISVRDLSQLFMVSQVTIRKDLEWLEEKNLILRTHGGAFLLNNEKLNSQLKDPQPPPNAKKLESAIIWLRNRVNMSHWSANEKLPSEMVLANEMGTDRATVRQAINALTSDKVFTKIKGRGTFVSEQYKPSSSIANNVNVNFERNDKPEGKQLIGVVVPSTQSPFVSGILTHLEHGLYNRGYRMLLTNSQFKLSLQGEHLQQLTELGVAGIVLYSGPFTYDEVVNSIVRRGIPFVMIDRYYPAIKTNLVATDHLRGAYMATEHLLKLGHRRIGFVISRIEAVTALLERFDGYKAALNDYGISYEEELVLRTQVRDVTIQNYLERARPTAIFAGNDLQAIEVNYTIHQLGLRVPDDIALVGFDDIPMASRIVPPLTTIAQSVYQLGEATANLIIDVVEHRVPKPKSIIIPPELVIRESSGGEIVISEDATLVSTSGTNKLLSK